MNPCCRVRWRPGASAALLFGVIAFFIGTLFGNSRARAQSEPIQPKIFEIYYDEYGKLTQTPIVAGSASIDTGYWNAGTNPIVLRPSGALKTVDADDIERIIRYRSGGVTLLVFYASYCTACHKFMPAVVQLARKWREKGLSVVAVSLDPEPEMFRSYSRRFADDIEVFRLRSYQSEKFSLWAGRLGMSVNSELFGIPAFAVFDRDGRLTTEKVGSAPFEKLDLALGQLLN